ncbi:MAG: hypothetical protein GY937_09135 [bacterium]|nr:hypothetical protein [bacterium]
MRKSVMVGKPIGRTLVLGALALVLSAMSCEPGAEGSGPTCTDERRAVIVDLDGTMTDDLIAPWALRDGTAELIEAYQGLGYEVIVLTGRWVGDLSGFGGISAVDVADFFDWPLCQEICACVWWDLSGNCTKRICEDVCAPALSLFDLTDIITFATPEFVRWVTELWIDWNGLTPDEVITSPTFIFPVEIIDFKIEVMQSLIDEGVVLTHGYGDDLADIVAYEAVGIPADGLVGARRLLTESDCLGDFTHCVADGFGPHIESYVSEQLPVCD